MPMPAIRPSPCGLSRPHLPAPDRGPQPRRTPTTRLRIVAAVLLAGALVLPGCSPLPEMARGAAEARSVGNAAKAYLEELPAREGEHEVLQVEASRPYTGLVLLSAPKDRSLPSRLRERDGISVPLERALGSAEVAQRITAATGLEVRFKGPPRAGDDGREVLFSGRQVGGAALGGQAIWSGSLSELLDEWTTELGYEWSYRPEREVIEVTRHASVSFILHALGGAQTYRVASSTSDRSGGGDEDRSANFSTQFLDTEYPLPALAGHRTSRGHARFRRHSGGRVGGSRHGRGAGAAAGCREGPQLSLLSESRSVAPHHGERPRTERLARTRERLRDGARGSAAHGVRQLP